MLSNETLISAVRFEQEALDRSCICMEMVDRYLTEHPFIEKFPSLKAKAELAHQTLFELYQEIAGMETAG